MYLSPTRSLGSCLCYFNFICFSISRLVPKVVLWVSGTPGASSAGEVTTELTRNDPLGGPAQAWLRQGTGSGAPATPTPTPHPTLSTGSIFGVGLSWGCLCSPLSPGRSVRRMSLSFPPPHCHVPSRCCAIPVQLRTYHMGQESPMPALGEGSCSLILDPMTCRRHTCPV